MNTNPFDQLKTALQTAGALTDQSLKEVERLQQQQLPQDYWQIKKQLAQAQAELEKAYAFVPGFAECERLHDEAKRLEADAAAVKQAWELASNRIDANFSHVPEALRARDWIGHVMHKAIYESTAGRSLLERLERYEKALNFYADEKHWLDENFPHGDYLSHALVDKGEQAREALKDGDI